MAVEFTFGQNQPSDSVLQLGLQMKSAVYSALLLAYEDAKALPDSDPSKPEQVKKTGEALITFVESLDKISSRIIRNGSGGGLSLGSF